MRIEVLVLCSEQKKLFTESIGIPYFGFGDIRSVENTLAVDDLLADDSEAIHVSFQCA